MSGRSLTLERLTKTFPTRVREGEVTAVDDVSLDIAQGEFVTQYDPRQVYPIGTEVRVQLATEALYLLPPGEQLPLPTGEGIGQHGRKDPQP